MSDLLLLLIGGLLVQPIGFRLQGGRRARLREELLGDFAILDELNDRPEMAARLNARIDSLLGRYVPDEARPRPVRDALVTSGLTGGLTVALVVIASVTITAADAPQWTLAVTGGLIGVVANVFADFLAAQRHKRRAQP